MSVIIIDNIIKFTCFDGYKQVIVTSYDQLTSWLIPEAATRTCSVKKMFLKISQNSQENKCARVSFLIELQTSASGGCFYNSMKGCFKY